LGALIGFVIGAVLGGGPLGGLGLVVGGFIGAVTGAVVLPLMTSASAEEYARHPHVVSCPATGQRMPVTVAKDSARAAFFGRIVTPRVADCPRWKQHGRCTAPCEKDLRV
jgi:hypothetical protein